MANKFTDWSNLWPEGAKVDLKDALLRLEQASEEEVLAWIGKVGVDEGAFKSLDEDVEAERERLRGDQVKWLMRRWKTDWTPRFLPAELSGLLEQWRGHLDVSCVGAYCAAVGALMRSFLLDGSAEIEAWGRIESPQESPTMHVFVEPGSVLAREQGFDKDGVDMRIEPSQLGHQIALRCGEPAPWGELAWRSLAGSLAEMEADSVLPRLTIRVAGDGAIEIKLAATTDKE